MVDNGRFYGNTRYGANLAGAGSFGVLRRLHFEGNGDEGIHFAGPFNSGATKPNRVMHSVALNNVPEGFYLLNANNVALDVNTASGNTAGLYVKQSPNVVVSHPRADGDYVHVYGNRMAGLLVDIDHWRAAQTAEGHWDRRSAEQQHVRPRVRSLGPGRRCARFRVLLRSVTSGANQFTNSAAKLVAGKTHVTAINASTKRHLIPLYPAGDAQNQHRRNVVLRFPDDPGDIAAALLLKLERLFRLSCGSALPVRVGCRVPSHVFLLC